MLYRLNCAAQGGGEDVILSLSAVQHREEERMLYTLAYLCCVRLQLKFLLQEELCLLVAAGRP